VLLFGVQPWRSVLMGPGRNLLRCPGHRYWPSATDVEQGVHSFSSTPGQPSQSKCLNAAEQPAGPTVEGALIHAKGRVFQGLSWFQGVRLCAEQALGRPLPP